MAFGRSKRGSQVSDRLDLQPPDAGEGQAARHFCPASRALVSVFIGRDGRGDVAGCRLFPSRRQERRRKNGHLEEVCLFCAGGGAGGMLPAFRTQR